MKSLRWLALLGFLCATAFYSPASAQAVTIRIGYNKLWPLFPLAVAIQKKIFEKYGVEPKWVEFQTPNDILRAMTAGELDMGAMTGPNLASAHERGIKVKGIALLAGVGDPPNMLFARKDLNIKSVKDLKDRTIGVNNYGGNFDLYLRRHLLDNGLDPKKDVKIVEIPVFQVLPAMLTRTIDAGFVDTVFAAGALKNNGNDVVPVFSYTDVGPFKSGYNGVILAANDSYIARNRSAAVNLLRGYLEAVRFMHDNQREAVKLYVDASGNKAAMLLDRGIDVPLDGQILLPQMRSELDLMAEFGYIKAKFDAAEVVDRSLLQEAAKTN